MFDSVCVAVCMQRRNFYTLWFSSSLAETSKFLGRDEFHLQTGTRESQFSSITIGVEDFHLNMSSVRRKERYCCQRSKSATTFEMVTKEACETSRNIFAFMESQNFQWIDRAIDTQMPLSRPFGFAVSQICRTELELVMPKSIQTGVATMAHVVSVMCLWKVCLGVEQVMEEQSR